MTRLAKLADIVQWVVGVATLTAVLMLFTLDGSPQEVEPFTSDFDQLLDDGRDIYAERCATCHGDTGQGGQGPRLAGTVVVNYPDVADEIALVTDGRGAMPPFALTLSDDEIVAVVAFTRFAPS